MEVIETIAKILFVTIFIGFFSIMIFTEQEINYETGSLTCEDVRECVLLDINCVKFDIKNTFLGVEWHVLKNSTKNQKEYYKQDCLNKHDAKRGKQEC